MRIACCSMLAACALGAWVAGTPVLAQAPTPGELSPSNQDPDMGPASQNMQTVGEHSDKPGVAAQGRTTPPSGDKPPPVGQPQAPPVADPESKTPNGVPPSTPTAESPSPHAR